MTIYLENTPVQQALQAWFEKAGSVLSALSLHETIPVTESFERITAEAVFARLSSPFFHASAMDGYAVIHTDTFGASETSPVRLRIPEQTVYLNTGDPLPEKFNAVIKIEDVNTGEMNETGKNVSGIEIISAVTPWQNVRVIGEDIVATELIVPENSRVRSIDMAAMLASGVTTIGVKRKPVIGIIPTGDEIVEPGTGLHRGDIIDSNSWMLAGLLNECGAVARRHPIVPDKKELLSAALEKALGESDIVLVIAGSSAGTEDFTAHVIETMGEVIVHGVNIKPGKPVVLGMVKGKPVVGIPGYPVSAFLAFRLFVKPLIDDFFGTGREEPEMISARLSRQISSPLGVEEFVRLKLGKVADTVMATPVSRGAGLIMSLARADAILRVPALSEGYAAGTEVSVELLRNRQDIENTVVCIGSHDNAIDILAQFLKKKHPRLSLSSAHVGSMGGIIAIKNREAHIAGTHLYDEHTGEYNVSYIRKLMGDRNLKLVNLVYRVQGLMVRKGNPKAVKSIQDLVKDDVVFVNRQAGSGTRLLMDKCLKDFNISPAAVTGYDRVEFTHMAVASAVQSGVADAGMGIYAASAALGLDFIPVARERYDLIIPDEFAGDEKLKALLDIIGHDVHFRTEVMKLGGYDVSDMGKIMYEQ